MPNITDILKERQPVKVVKARKDDNTREYVDKIHEATGWEKRAIYFQVPHNRLKEALDYCLHYTDIKTRNFKLKEFITLTKIRNLKTQMGNYPKKSELETLKMLENKLIKT